MNRSIAMVAAGLFALLAGCGPTISVDYDPATDFTGLKTFNWIPVAQERSVETPEGPDPLLHKRIQFVLENQLIANGFIRQPEGTPDFYVGYRMVIDEKVNVTSINNYYGYSSGWGRTYYRGGYYGPHTRSYQRSYVDYYEQGTLIVDISLPETRQLIWRATAEAELDPQTEQAKRDRKLKQAVSRMLEQFPPTPDT